MSVADAPHAFELAMGATNQVGADEAAQGNVSTDPADKPNSYRTAKS